MRNHVQLGVSGQQRERKVVVDVGVHSRKRKLDAINAGAVASLKQCVPCRGHRASAQRAADYQSVNELLKTVMPSALTMLATDTLGVLAEDTGKIGRLLAFWDICSARNLAWDFANHLRDLTSE